MKRKIKIILTTILIFSLFTANVFAYVELSYGYESTTIPVKNSLWTSPTTPVNCNYSYIFDSSAQAWNGSGCNALIYSSSSSSNKIVNVSVQDTWNGMYTATKRQYVLWGKATEFKIELNHYILAPHSDNYRQSVLVHELGHALSLDDNPPESPSIMRHDRDREIVITPRNDDVYGVNQIY